MGSKAAVARWPSLMPGVRNGYPPQISSSPLETKQDRRPEGTLKLREICTIRVRLQFRSNLRIFALFNLAIDSKLRACDLLSMRVAHRA